MNPIRYIQLALVLMFLGGGVYGVWSYRSMAAKAEQLDQARTALKAAEENITALQGQYKTLSEQSIRRQEFDAELRKVRQGIARNVDTVTREDPATADYLSQRLPQRLRDAYLKDSAAQAERR